jgi:hypothetical protein
MIGIGGEGAFVPDPGVVVAPELAARITDQVRHVGIVVMIKSAQLCNRRFVLAILVDKRIGGFVAGDEVFSRTTSIALSVCFFCCAGGDCVVVFPPPEGAPAPAATAKSGATRIADRSREMANAIVIIVLSACYVFDTVVVR